MYINNLIAKIEQITGKSAKRNGKGYNCCCPAHDDTHPSLSVTEASDGKILLQCHAGCSLEEICSTLDLQVSELFPKEDQRPYLEQDQKEYIYSSEDGCPLYKKVRTSQKKFFIYSYVDSRNWEKGLNRDQRVLYRLPEVIKARKNGTLIFLVEGEKDADRLFRAGLVGTTPIEGAGSSLRLEYADQLEEGNIVLLYDEDKAGYKRRDQWKKLLQGRVKSIKVIKLPGLTYQDKSGEDVSDWLQKGHTTNELLDLAKQAQPMSCNDKSKGLAAVDIQEFLNKEITERKMILSPIIPSQGLLLLYSKRGVGKTFLSLAIGYAVAAGIPLLRWRCVHSVPVLYVDGEMPASLMQERLAKLIAGIGVELPNPSYFRLVTPDLQDEGIPDISTEYGQQLLENVIGEARLIILDNLSTLAPSLQENESDSWAPIQSWILKLRKQGISVLLVHHAGKSGNQRGTSRREDVLDSVIVLKHAKGYSAAEGASFEVHIEKARGFYGDDAEPFLVSLKTDSNGSLCWSEESVQDDLYDLVVGKIKSGMSFRDTAKELGVSKSKVEGIVKSAREKGDLSTSSDGN